ncbi:MAG TPA: VTT domain-containing protein, partial [Polyangiaceae bacterium]
MRPVIFGLLVITLLVVGRVVPVGWWLESSSQQLRHSGALGAVIFVLGYSLGALLFVPSAMFTFVAGFTYGAFVGTLIGIPGIATSALLVFALSRTLLRKPVESWLRRDPRFVAVDRLIARLGARAVVLLRLSPISPFSVLNYA